jgi:ABC-type spermidine/putrescine transport system permease subunit II
MSDASTPLTRRSLEPTVFRVLTLAFTVFIVAYILIPILVTLVMSFNDASQIRFPIKVWSLKWYGDFFASPQWTEALFNSFTIALGTALIATTSGILAAWAFERYDFPMKSVLYVLIMMPLFMPGVVLGLGVAIAFGGVEIAGVNIYGSRGLVMIAHALWAMPLVFMLMEATFRTIDNRVVEAAQDLGAPPIRTFFEVVIPMVSTGVISSVLFAFVISLNEFVMALFLTDRDTQTLPVLMWLSLRSAGTPRLAVASVILACTVFLCLTLIMLWYIRQLRKVAR